MDVLIRVDGMTCGGCVAAVEKALRAAGADEVSVDLKAGTARLRGTNDDGVERYLEAVRDAGYDATPG